MFDCITPSPTYALIKRVLLTDGPGGLGGGNHLLIWDYVSLKQKAVTHIIEIRRHIKTTRNPEGGIHKIRNN